MTTPSFVKSPLTRAILLASATLAAASPLQAANRTWDGNYFTCDDEFDSSSCWSSFSVPGSGDNALFPSSDAGTVSFVGSNQFNAGTWIQGGAYTWNMAGRTYTMSSQFTVQSAGTLVITGGGQVNAGFTYIANDLTVQGNSRFNAGTFLNVFNNGTRVTGTAGNIQAGRLSLDIGADMITGSTLLGATTTNSGWYNSLGDMAVDGGGTTYTTNYMDARGSAIDVTVSNSGFIDINGTFDLRSGARASTTGGGRIEANSLRLFSAGQLTSDIGTVGYAGAGFNSIGDATVSGTGSAWNVGSTLTVSGFGKDLFVENGGMVDVGGELTVRSGGTLTQTSGGRVEAGSLGVTSSGVLKSSTASIGSSTTANGHISVLGNASVDGGGRWETVALGMTGAGTQLTVNSNGQVLASGDVTLENSAQITTTGGGRVGAKNLVLKTGGKISSSSATIGGALNASGEVSATGDATVNGSATQWRTGGLLVQGAATKLDLQSGGRVAVSGAATLKDYSITDARAGKFTAGRLRVESGAGLLSNTMVIGTPGSLSGDTVVAGNVTVTGNATQLSPGQLYLRGNGSLDVTGSGVVALYALDMQGNSRLDTTGGGRVNAVTAAIAGGAQVKSSSALIGSTGAANGRVNVTGNVELSQTGRWTSGSMDVTGVGTSLDVLTKGAVDVSGLLTLRDQSKTDTTGDGILNSTSLLMQSGARLGSFSARVGAQSIELGSANVLGDATLTGANTVWTTGTMQTSAGGLLTIVDGAKVDVKGAMNGKGGVLLVDGGQLQAGSLGLDSFELRNTHFTVDGYDASFGAETRLDVRSKLIASGKQVTLGGTIESGGAIEAREGGAVTIGNKATMYNASLRSLAGSQVTIEGGARVDGGFLEAAGEGAGLDVQSGGAINNAIVQAFDGGNLNVDGSINGGSVRVFNGGSLTGSGDINADLFNVSGGTVNVGNSPGTMSADNYTQDDNSLFLVELAGYDQGAPDGYDWLNVTGTADLAGLLEVQLLNGFDPVVGSSFDIVTASIINGMFDTTVFPSIAGIQWELQTLIDASGDTDILRLSAVAAVPVPAAVWLFGSALITLVGLKRKAAA